MILRINKCVYYFFSSLSYYIAEFYEVIYALEKTYKLGTY